MTDPARQLTDEEEADLAAHADGRLDPARLERLEARARSEPVLQAALSRQRVAVSAIAAAAAQVSAPLALRGEVDRMRARPARRTLRQRLLPRGWLIGAGAIAAVALAVVVVRIGVGPGVGDFVAASSRPPVAAIAPVARGGKLLREEVEGVRFPAYAGTFGWRASGARTDRIGGRASRTVFYERGGRRIAYTIVAGEALAQPGDAARATREGVALRTFRNEGRRVVTWRRQGHTCVLSGRDVPVAALLELAGWRGKGAVPV